MSVLEIPFQFKWKLASKSEAMKREASRLWKFALRMKHLAVGRSVWFSHACSLVNFIFPCAQCALPIFQCEHLCPSYFVLTMYQVHIIKYINWCCNLSRFGIIDFFSFLTVVLQTYHQYLVPMGTSWLSISNSAQIPLIFNYNPSSCSVHFDVCICQCFTTNTIIRNRKNTAWQTATFAPLDLHPYWSTNAQ